MPDAEKKDEKNCQLQMKRSLTKKERLKTKEEISRVFTSSNRFACSGAKLVIKKNILNRNRIAVTLVRKYGNSVTRNRSKRVVREIYRNLKFSIKPGWDIVIVLYPGNYDYYQRRKQFICLLNKAMILLEKS